ncbi:hypothetical protein B9Z55_003296 [Caenorhabditis nigoni]|nr:hypothetical protein B9Z55_003296 [Caenorhabditis nigoni]
MPLLIKRIIIEELGFDERLFLSFTSKRTCGLLGLLKNDLKGISITINIDNSEITVCVQKPSHRWSEQYSVFNICSYFGYNCNFNIPYEQRYGMGSSARTIGDSTVQPVLYPSTIYCDLNDKRVGRYTASNLVIVFGNLLRHLNKFLNIENCLLCEFDKTIPVGLIHQLDCTYSYERIYVRDTNVMDVSPKDLTFLLENIKASQLSLNVKVLSVPGYKYQKSPEKNRSIDWLKIYGYSWVDFSELPAARLLTFVEKIQPDQMNMMLKSWVAGRNRDMEIGDFEFERLTDLNCEAIFNGITRHETQLTKAEIGKFIEFVNGEKFVNIAVDILRESDGIRVTVIGAWTGPMSRYYINETQKMYVMVWSDSNLRAIGRTNQ